MKQLIPSFHFGLFVPAALAASLLSWSATVSQFLWVIFWIARFVRLQTFAQATSSLFLTLVPSFRRVLSSGFPVCFPLSSFQRRLFLLLLHTYFSGVAKCALFAAPAVGSAFLFAEADVSRQLSDIQSSSSLRSQQSLVAISSRSAGARSSLFPSHGSPAQQYPTGHRCCDSGSPACGSCRGRLDSLSPSSALMSSWRGFWAIGVLPFSCPRGLFGDPLEGVGVLGCRPLSCVSYGSATVVLPGASPSFQCPHSFPLYSQSSVRGLAVGALFAALHTLGELDPAPLFTAAFFYLSWLWLPFLLALRCILTVVRFCFAFLVRIPPSQGFSALVFGRSLGSSVTVRCFVLLSIVWDRRLCFPFFLSVSGCSSASVESPVPPRRGPPFGQSQ